MASQEATCPVKKLEKEESFMYKWLLNYSYCVAPTYLIVTNTCPCSVQINNQDTDFLWFLPFSGVQHAFWLHLYISLPAHFLPAAKSHAETWPLNDIPFILFGCVQYSEVDMFAFLKQFNIKTQTFREGWLQRSEVTKSMGSVSSGCKDQYMWV